MTLLDNTVSLITFEAFTSERMSENPEKKMWTIRNARFALRAHQERFLCDRWLTASINRSAVSIALHS